MKAFFTTLAMAAALVPRILCAEALPEDTLADEYLLKVGVGRGMFVSLVPAACTNMFEKEPIRKDAWKRRVAERIGDGLDPGRVDVRPADSEVGVDNLVDSWRNTRQLVNWLDWVQDDDKALSVVRMADDGGGSIVQTNVFSISRDEANVNDRRVRLDGKGAGGLVAGRGVGETVWVLPWKDLGKRWDDEKDAKKILDCWRSIYEGDRCKGSTPGAAAWKRRLEDYWDGRRRLWPGIELRNARDEAILLRCREKGSQRWGTPIQIEAKGVAGIPALRNPRKGYDMEWQFYQTNATDRCWDDCATQDPERANDMTPTIIFVSSDLSSFKALPKLRFSKQVFQGEDFRRVVPRVNVVYEGPDGSRSADEADVDLDGAVPVADIPPHRKIVEVSINGDDTWFGKQSVAIGRAFNCGDTPECPRFELLPWPEIALKNGSEDAAKVKVSVVVGADGGATAREWTLASEQSASKTVWAWSGGSEPPEASSEIEVEVTAQADNYKPWRKTLVLHRGGAPADEEIHMEPKSMDWPSQIKKAFDTNCKQLSTILSNPRTSDLEEPEGVLLRKYFSAIATGVVADVEDHLANCRKKDCKAHDAFLKKHGGDLAGKQGDARRVALFVALWSDAFKLSAKEYSPGKTKAERLRELLDEYVLGGGR